MCEDACRIPTNTLAISAAIIDASGGMRILRLLVAVVVLLWAPSALAEVFHAPVGGRAFAFGQNRVLCGPAPAGWTAEQGGRAVKPPSSRAVIGRVVDAAIATSAAECARSPIDVRLVATGPVPIMDRSSVVWFVDEGRLEADGSALGGSIVSWSAPGGPEADTCSAQPTSETGAVKAPGIDHCIWSIAKTLPTDPASSPLHLWPQGALGASDSILHDVDGRRVPASSLAISPKKIVVSSFLPSSAAVDVSLGVGVLPLLHPEALASVECRGATCRTENGQLHVQAPPEGIGQIEARFNVVPGITTPKPGPVVTKIAILRCPMEPVSGAVMRGIQSARAIVKLGAACAKDADALHFFLGARPLDVAQKITTPDGTFVVLAIGRVDSNVIPVTAVRAGAESAVVAATRIETRPSPTPRSVLEIPGFPGLDFVPYNRFAVVHFPRVDEGELVLLPVEGVYSAEKKDGVTQVRGDRNAAGLATFQFAFRATQLPKPLSEVDLALYSDPIQRTVKEANEPAPYDATAKTKEPLAELICNDEDGKAMVIVPGVQTRLAFNDRDGCRLVIHRERLAPEFGAQKLRIEVEVRQVDNALRPDGSLNERVVLRRGAEPKVSWIKGVQQPYDHVTVRLTHEGDETFYLGGESILKNAPALQWSLVFGTGRVRIYATSAIPTGLYRFGGKNGSGAMALNFGVISRFTWVNKDGKEGLLAAEAGVMAFGLTGDASTTGGTLTQVGGVFGLGLAIPIANASQATQASINLHGWFEQRLTGGGDSKGSAQAFIFGPSISIGNIGGTF